MLVVPADGRNWRRADFYETHAQLPQSAVSGRSDESESTARFDPKRSSTVASYVLTPRENRLVTGLLRQSFSRAPSIRDCERKPGKPHAVAPARSILASAREIRLAFRSLRQFHPWTKRSICSGKRVHRTNARLLVQRLLACGGSRAHKGRLMVTKTPSGEHVFKVPDVAQHRAHRPVLSYRPIPGTCGRRSP